GSRAHSGECRSAREAAPQSTGTGPDILWLRRVGPGQGTFDVLVRWTGNEDSSRDSRLAEADVLPLHRGPVHAHRQPPGPPVAGRADGGDREPNPVSAGRAASNSQTLGGCRGV